MYEIIFLDDDTRTYSISMATTDVKDVDHRTTIETEKGRHVRAILNPCNTITFDELEKRYNGFGYTFDLKTYW